MSENKQKEMDQALDVILVKASATGDNWNAQQDPEFAAKYKEQAGEFVTKMVNVIAKASEYATTKGWNMGLLFPASCLEAFLRTLSTDPDYQVYAHSVGHVTARCLLALEEEGTRTSETLLADLTNALLLICEDVLVDLQRYNEHNDPELRESAFNLMQNYFVLLGTWPTFIEHAITDMLGNLSITNVAESIAASRVGITRRIILAH